MKAEHQKPSGLLQPLPIPEWKWEEVAMDFVRGLPPSKKANDGIWVIVDTLTKSAHFIPVKNKLSMEKHAELYVNEIVRLHGIPVSIVSDRDPRFESRFWKGFQVALGTKLNFSTAFHPESDGQSERVIQILEDMLRVCALDFKEDWEKHLPLIEFAYNNGFQTSIGMAPYEALYGRKCRSPICWEEVGDRKILGPEIVQLTTDKIKLIQQRLKTAKSRYKSYADVRRKKLEFQKGDFVFLRVSPSKGIIRFGKRGKLNPRYVGPYEIIERIGLLAYRLNLPPELARVHNVFHISMLRRYFKDASHILESVPLEIREDMTYIEQPVEILSRRDQVLRTKTIPLVKVLWRNQEREAEM